MKKPTVQERENTTFLYRNFMVDIKARVKTIEKAYSLVKAQNLHHWEAENIAYLQLRMICELIALGCLTAHNEMITTSAGKMRREYRPNVIFTELEKLHPSFYPSPDRGIVNDKGESVSVPPGMRNQSIGPVRIVPLKDGFLTKKQLIKLVGQCGDKLHIGGTKKYFANRPPDQAPIMAAIKLIQNLLRFHRIKFIDPDYFIWAQMEPDAVGAEPLIALLSRKPPTTNSQT
jgi:hypothetical protein